MKDYISRFTAATILVGLILLATLPHDSIGEAPRERNWVFARLDRDHSIRQTFISTRRDLYAVRVLLFAPPTAQETTVMLRIRYFGADATENLVQVGKPLRELSRQSFTTFTFAPMTPRGTPHTITATLELVLEAPALAPEDAIQVITGPDSYSDGQLFINEREFGYADLAFQPVYRSYLLNNILPLTALAEGKPGLLGWPPSYAILAILALTFASGIGIRLSHFVRRKD